MRPYINPQYSTTALGFASTLVNAPTWYIGRYDKKPRDNQCSQGFQTTMREIYPLPFLVGSIWKRLSDFPSLSFTSKLSIHPSCHKVVCRKIEMVWGQYEPQWVILSLLSTSHHRSKVNKVNSKKWFVNGKMWSQLTKLVNTRIKVQHSL